MRINKTRFFFLAVSVVILAVFLMMRDGPSPPPVQEETLAELAEIDGVALAWVSPNELWYLKDSFVHSFEINTKEHKQIFKLNANVVHLST